MTEEQSQMFELLRTFKRLCEAHRLQYHLAGGTLLGAVRHQGFIPWDDDVDVSMPLEDYLKFQELSAELPSPVKIQSEKNDPRYPFVFLKLCDVSHPFHTGFPNEPKGVYIDVFPLIPSRGLSWETKLRFEIINVVNYVLQVKLDWAAFVPYKRPEARFGFWLLNHFSPEHLRRLRRTQISMLYDPNSRGTLCSPGGAYKADKEFFPAEWFRETAELTFEGERFAAPIGWHAYLSRHYGNYMKLPPFKERRTRHKQEPS